MLLLTVILISSFLEIKSLSIKNDKLNIKITETQSKLENVKFELRGCYEHVELLESALDDTCYGRAPTGDDEYDVCPEPTNNYVWALDPDDYFTGD